MKEFVGKPEDKLMNLMDPANPMMSGVVQNQDSYMKGKIAQRWYYDQVEPALEEAFDEFYRARPAEVRLRRCRTAARRRVHPGRHGLLHGDGPGHGRLPARRKGIKAGCLNVYCFRPFPARQIVEALKHCKAFTVIERMDDPLSTTGNHLTREIKAAFCDAMTGQNGLEPIDRIPRIYHGAAGLGSRDVRPGDIIAIFDNMIPRRAGLLLRRHRAPLALKVTEDPDLRPPAPSRCAGIRSAASAR
jgi:pyruvate-ferredoxin/flavodoxin oxidoreductase